MNEPPIDAGELDAGDLEEVLARAADPDRFEAWQVRAKATGWCTNPVRLVGSASRVDTATGEVAGRIDSAGMPDRVLLKACGHRRATRCPTCSATYQSDAYQLVAAGLRGGKGVPETVSAHPMVFVTLTAPTFGLVHTTHDRDGKASRCQAQSGTCPHGRPRSCPAVHPLDDPLVGQALCADCFDYRGAVIWNALAGELWRRTTIALQRQLAAQAGIPRRVVAEQVRLSYSKVAEYQRRGLIHVHAVIRLDAAAGIERPPPIPFDQTMLATAVATAVAIAACPCPTSPGLAGPLHWGRQLDVRPIGAGGTVPKGVAGYLAKYATKSTDPDSLLDRPVRPGDLDRLDRQLSSHLARMVRAAWDLGGRPELAHLRLRAWAHTLGYGGHWLTKSRRYSTTFAALRDARHQWNLHHAAGNEEPRETTTVGEWSYAGRGWTTGGDAWLARTAARQTTASRRTAREEYRAMTGGDHRADP